MQCWRGWWCGKKSLQRAPWSFCCFSDPLVCLLKNKWFSHKLLWFSHYMWLSQITIIATHKWFSHKWLLLWHNCDSLSNLYDCHTQVFPLTIWGSATPPVPVGHVGFSQFVNINGHGIWMMLFLREKFIENNRPVDDSDTEGRLNFI